MSKKAKENKKNKKSNGKLKKVLIAFFVILLIVILLFGGLFGFNYFRHVLQKGNNDYDPLSAAALGIDPDKLKNVGRINILVLGESGVGDGYKLTDSIMIISYNPQTQQATILSIPRDTYVGKKNKETASTNYLASYKMNAVYRNGTNIDETIECVNNITGLNIEKYVLVDTDAIVEIVDAVGGIRFNVPIDMDYDDGKQNLHIHLKAGEQLIDGDKAEQLLRFRHNNDGTSYPMEYGDNDIGRMRTQREFLQEAAKQLLKIENATKVVNLLDIVFNNVKTNLDLQSVKYYIPYAFKFNTQNIETAALPGTPEKYNGVWIYTVNKTKTKALIEELFTDKVVEEETEENSVSNTTTDSKSSKTSTTNTTSSSTSSSSTNTTKSSSSTNSSSSSTKTTSSIKVEILNGTGSEATLTNVKDKLKSKGYIVSKAGNTSSTSTTTIINRTKKSEEEENKLKEVLQGGKITKGSNNTNVDFTIIIGKDYK